MNKNTSALIGFIIVLLIGAAIYFFVTYQQEPAEQKMDVEQAMEETTEPTTEVMEDKSVMQTQMQDYNYVLKAEESTFQWTGKKVGSEHTGTVDIKSGTVRVSDTQEIEEAEFVIDMTTISNDDLTDENMNKTLVDHLKNDDFFSVSDYPEAILHITEAQPIAGAGEEEPNYELTGNLAIKGIVNEITFPARIVQNGDGTVSATATFPVDRTKWNVRYGSDKFFDNLGDNVINDEFIATLDLVFEPKESS